MENGFEQSFLADNQNNYNNLVSECQDHDHSNLSLSLSSNGSLDLFIDLCKQNDDSSKEMRALYDDLLKMPDCAERNLLAMQYIFQFKQANRIPYDLDCFKIDEELEKFKDRVDLKSPAVHEFLANCKEDFYKGRWTSLLKQTKTLKEQIIGLNVREVIRFVKKLKTSIEFIEEQHTVLLIGQNKVETLNIFHFLAGSRLLTEERPAANDNNPFQRKNEYLKKISCVSSKIQMKWIISMTAKSVIGESSCEDESLDSSLSLGFSPSFDSEFEIAESLSIQHIIQKSKKVSPVLLISDFSQDKIEGLGKLLHFFKEMISNQEDYKKFISSITYIFTKCLKEKSNEIHGTIKTLLQNNKHSFETNDNQALISVLEDMLAKTEKESIVIDHENDKSPRDSLEKITENHAIEVPDRVFNFVMNKRSRDAISLQINRHKKTIISALSDLNLPLAKYKLEELKSFEEHIQDKELKRLLDWSDEINKQIINEYYKISSQIKSSMEEIHQTETQMKKPKDTDLKFRALLDLRNSLVQQKDNDKPEKTFHLVNFFKTEIENLFQELEYTSPDISIIECIRYQLELILNHFPDLLKSFQSKDSIISECFDQICNAFSDFLKQGQFERSSTELLKIKIVSSTWRDKTLKMKEKYQDLKEQFVLSVKATVQSLESILEKSELSERDIESINLSLERLESIQNNLTDQNLKNEIQYAYESCIQKIHAFFLRLKDCGQLRESSIIESLSAMEKPMHQLCLIEKIPFLQEVTQVKNDMLRRLRELLQEILHDIVYDTENKTIHFITKTIIILFTKNQWIQNYEQRLFSSVIQRIEEKIRDYYNQSKLNLKRLTKSPKIYKWDQNAFQIIENMTEMMNLDDIFPKSKEDRQEIVHLFNEKINSYLQNVKELLDKLNETEFANFKLKLREKQQLEDFLHYLEATQEIPQLEESASELQNYFQLFLESYMDYLSQNFQANYEILYQYRVDQLSTNSKPTYHQEEQAQANSLIPTLDISQSSKQVQDSAQMMSKCIRGVREFQKIIAQFPILSPLQELMDQWQTKLTFEYQEINFNLEMLQQTTQIITLERMVVFLKDLESLNKIFENIQYEDLYFNSKKRLFSKIEEVKKEIIESIASGDDIRATELIKNFATDAETSNINVLVKKSAKDFQHELQEHFRKLLGEIKNTINSLLNDLTPEKIENVVAQLQKLKKISKLRSSCLSPQTLQDSLQNLESDLNEMKEKIGNNLQKYCSQINLYMSSYDFKEANQLKNLLKEFLTMLDGFCPKDMHTIFSDLDAFEERQLNELQILYKNMKSSHFKTFPAKENFKKIESCFDIHPKYRKVREVMENEIIQIFEKEAEEAKGLDKEHLTSLEKLIDESLPERLAANIKKRLYDYYQKMLAENTVKIYLIQKN